MNGFIKPKPRNGTAVMPRSSQRFEVKLTIAKLISFAYDHDKQFMATISGQHAPFTMTLNQHGDVEIEAQTGKLRFSINQQQKAKLGFDTKWVSVRFGTNGEYFTYDFSGHLNGLTISVTGAVDLFKLIKECTGLLCQAARVINADSRFENSVENAFFPR